ncbi:hypothetical protein B296_00032032 [Ensete ventricosum]|uniref:Uncharacterized protein n=1 Tax=Ensete ventricosum TaxID=4639 RepID=A0A427AEP6_ENSVE|nr:hypothetical protein B296_00032032 [Ensete ventricosum]
MTSCKNRQTDQRSRSLIKKKRSERGEGNLVGAERDVGLVDENIALEGVVGGEVGDVAAVDGRLVGAQVEAVAQTEEKIGGRRHHRRFVVVPPIEIERFCGRFRFVSTVECQHETKKCLQSWAGPDWINWPDRNNHLRSLAS